MDGQAAMLDAVVTVRERDRTWAQLLGEMLALSTEHDLSDDVLSHAAAAGGPAESVSPPKNVELALPRETRAGPTVRNVTPSDDGEDGEPASRNLVLVEPR